MDRQGVRRRVFAGKEFDILVQRPIHSGRKGSAGALVNHLIARTALVSCSEVRFDAGADARREDLARSFAHVLDLERRAADEEGDHVLPGAGPVVDHAAGGEPDERPRSEGPAARH